MRRSLCQVRNDVRSFKYRDIDDVLTAIELKDTKLTVCVEVLRPVNPIGSCRARSVYLITFLLDRLSPLSGLPVLCIFFRQDKCLS